MNESQPEEFSPMSELDSSWTIVSENWLALTIAYFIRSWVALFCGLLAFAVLIDHKGWNLAAYALVAWLVWNYLHAGFLKLCKNLCLNGKIDWSSFKIDINTGINMFFRSVLYVIVCVIGFALLLVPGLIVCVNLSLSGFSLIDGKGPIESFKESLKLFKGSFWVVAIPFLMLVGFDCIVGIFSLAIEALLTIFLCRFYLFRTKAESE